LRRATDYEEIAGTATTTVMRCGGQAYLRPPRGVARWRARCTGPGEQVAVSGRVLGSPTLQVGSRSVPTMEVEVDEVYSGAQHGIGPCVYWLTADNVIVRQRETVAVAEGTGPLGAVDYHEAMVADLASLTPTR
jgi:hypothetical protein